MSASVLYMSMSLDGHIAGPNDGPDSPGGDGFMRLHDWYGFGPDGPKGGPSGVQGRHFMDEINASGAVLAGRRTVEQVDHWGGNHHGVPISTSTRTTRLRVRAFIALQLPHPVPDTAGRSLPR
jgi:hypothetical protein